MQQQLFQSKPENQPQSESKQPSVEEKQTLSQQGTNSLQVEIDKSQLDNPHAIQWISIFALDSIIHLFACFVGNLKLRYSTKVFLMPLLLKVYLTLTPKINQSKSLIAALILGAIGDAFLIYNEYMIFIILGLLCFTIGHTMYIVSLARRIGIKQFKKNFWLFGIFLSFFLMNCYYQYQRFIKGWIAGTVYVPAGIIYLTITGLINTFAWTLFFVKISFYSFFICVGTALFWYSDFTLVKIMFHEPDMYLGSFIVMITYISAQTNIVIGMSRQTN